MHDIKDIIEDLRQGKMVILMDDEDRENEGDLMMAAECVRPEDINFMARFGRGLICLTITDQRSRQLNLPPMVSNNQAEYSTNFTVSIEAAQGVTTGISAADRAHTIKTAVAKDANPEDLIQPGHVFPLVAQPGGVLNRAGHTEAGCDLARLAGLEPAAVIVEILNEDGSMARRPDLERFADEHNIKMGTIADLIEYRLTNETTIERVAEKVVETEYGEFTLVSYTDAIDKTLHFALVKGEVSKDTPTLVRVHVEDKLSESFLLTDNPGRWPLHQALRHLANQGQGVLVYLSQPLDSQKMLANLLSRNKVSVDIDAQMAKKQDLRTVGAGSQILADLGVQKMCLLSSPKKYHALSGYHLEIVDYVPYKDGC